MTVALVIMFRAAWGHPCAMDGPHCGVEEKALILLVFRPSSEACSNIIFVDARDCCFAFGHLGRGFGQVRVGLGASSTRCKESSAPPCCVEIPVSVAHPHTWSTRYPRHELHLAWKALRSGVAFGSCIALRARAMSPARAALRKSNEGRAYKVTQHAAALVGSRYTQARLTWLGPIGRCKLHADLRRCQSFSPGFFARASGLGHGCAEPKATS